MNKSWRSSTSRSWRIAAIFRFTAVLGLCQLLVAGPTFGQAKEPGIEQQFAEVVRPLLTSYCVRCHGDEKQEGKLKLTGYTSAASVAKDYKVWDLVRRRLEAEEMPPE